MSSVAPTLARAKAVMDELARRGLGTRVLNGKIVRLDFGERTFDVKYETNGCVSRNFMDQERDLAHAEKDLGLVAPSPATHTRASILAAIQGYADGNIAPGSRIRRLWGDAIADVYNRPERKYVGQRYRVGGLWVCDEELDEIAEALNERDAPKPEPVPTPRPDVGCPTCHGSGRAARGGPNPCDVCGGKGRLPPAREPDEPRCLASCGRPRGTIDPLYCTRPDGHEGDHVGHLGIGADARALGSWPADAVRPAPAETPRPSVDEPLPLWTGADVLACLRKKRDTALWGDIFGCAHGSPAYKQVVKAHDKAKRTGERHETAYSGQYWDSELEAMAKALSEAGVPPPRSPAAAPAVDAGPAKASADAARDFLRRSNEALPCEVGAVRGEALCSCKACSDWGSIGRHVGAHGVDAWAENALAGAKANREARASANAGVHPGNRPNRCPARAPGGPEGCTLDAGHPAALGHVAHGRNGERVREWSVEAPAPAAPAPAPAAPQLCSCDACPTCAERGDRCGMAHPTAAPCMRPSGHDGPHESRRSAEAPALLWSTPTVAFDAYELYSVEVIAEALDPICRQAVLVGVTPLDKALEVAERALAEYAAETAERYAAAQALALAIERVKEGRAR